MASLPSNHDLHVCRCSFRRYGELKRYIMIVASYFAIGLYRRLSSLSTADKMCTVGSGCCWSVQRHARPSAGQRRAKCSSFLPSIVDCSSVSLRRRPLTERACTSEPWDRRRFELAGGDRSMWREVYSSGQLQRSVVGCQSDTSRLRHAKVRSDRITQTCRAGDGGWSTKRREWFDGDRI